jgi:hypothetical protein
MKAAATIACYLIYTSGFRSTDEGDGAYNDISY